MFRTQEQRATGLSEKISEEEHWGGWLGVRERKKWDLISRNSPSFSNMRGYSSCFVGALSTPTEGKRRIQTKKKKEKSFIRGERRKWGEKGKSYSNTFHSKNNTQRQPCYKPKGTEGTPQPKGGKSAGERNIEENTRGEEEGLRATESA